MNGNKKLIKILNDEIEAQRKEIAWLQKQLLKALKKGK